MHRPEQSLKPSSTSIFCSAYGIDDLHQTRGVRGGHRLENVKMELDGGDSAGESTNASWVNAEDLGRCLRVSISH